MSVLSSPVTRISAPGHGGTQPRPRLFAALDVLCASPILWLGGPAGSGKSILVASYLAARAAASTWLHIGAELRAGVARLALQDVLAGMSQPSFLVLDDCHRVAGDVLSEFAREWASRAEPGMHLVLIARGEPPASLAPLIVRGFVAVMEAAELELSVEEMRQWATSLNADAAALAHWHGKCRGWTLGVARALEALRRDREDTQRSFETAKREVFAYFAAEVFGHAAPTDRQALASAALVERASFQTAQALSGNTEAFEVLARISAQHGFITRSPGSATTFQFMPLYREFLLARIADSFPPVELQALARRASALLDEDPDQNWFGDCKLIEAYRLLRKGDRAGCQRALGAALVEAHVSPTASQACAIFPAAVAQLCAEALHAGIEPDSARRLIERHHLPAPAEAGQRWPWAFKVQVLGEFRLLKGDAPLRLSRRAQRKPLELLQALIAFGATEVPARGLIDALWPDSEGDAGYHALESTLYRLRQLLGAPDAVRMASSRLSLDRRQFHVDLWELERELQHARAADARLTERMGQIRQLYQGHLLQHESEQPWAVKARQTLRDRFMRCLRDAARVYESRHNWQEAARVYQSGLELESLNEDLYRGLMVCHRELGAHSEAVHAYRRCRELLTRFLGVPPNTETQAIYQSVRERAACMQVSAS